MTREDADDTRARVLLALLSGPEEGQTHRALTSAASVGRRAMRTLMPELLRERLVFEAYVIGRDGADVRRYTVPDECVVRALLLIRPAEGDWRSWRTMSWDVSVLRGLSVDVGALSGRARRVGVALLISGEE